MSNVLLKQKLNELRNDLYSLYRKTQEPSSSPDFFFQCVQHAIDFEAKSESQVKEVEPSSELHKQFIAIYGYAVLQVAIGYQNLGVEVFSKEAAPKIDKLITLLEAKYIESELHWLYCYALFLKGEYHIYNNEFKEAIELLDRIDVINKEYEGNVASKPWFFHDIIGRYDIETRDFNLEIIKQMSADHILSAAIMLKDPKVIFEKGISGIRAKLRLSARNIVTTDDLVECTLSVTEVMLKRRHIKQTRNLLAFILYMLDTSQGDPTISEKYSSMRHSVVSLCIRYLHELLVGCFAIINLNTSKFFQQEVTTDMIQQTEIYFDCERIGQGPEIEAFESQVPDYFKMHPKEIEQVISTLLNYIQEAKELDNSNNGLEFTKIDYDFYQGYIEDVQNKLPFMSGVEEPVMDGRPLLENKVLDEKLLDIKSRFWSNLKSLKTQQHSTMEFIQTTMNLYHECRETLKTLGVYHIYYKKYVPVAGCLALIVTQGFKTIDIDYYRTDMPELLSQIELMLEVLRLTPQGVWLYVAALYCQTDLVLRDPSSIMDQYTEQIKILERIEDTYNDYCCFETVKPFNSYQILGNNELNDDLKLNTVADTSTVLQHTRLDLILTAIDMNDPHLIAKHSIKGIKAALKLSENSHLTTFEFLDTLGVIVFELFRYLDSMSQILHVIAVGSFKLKEYRDASPEEETSDLSKHEAQIAILYAVYGKELIERSLNTVSDDRNFYLRRDFRPLVDHEKLQEWESLFPTELTKNVKTLKNVWENSIPWLDKADELALSINADEMQNTIARFKGALMAIEQKIN